MAMEIVDFTQTLCGKWYADFFIGNDFSFKEVKNDDNGYYINLDNEKLHFDSVQVKKLESKKQSFKEWEREWK